MKRLFFMVFTLLALNSACFIPNSAALDRFVDLKNGTMLDTQSSLIWLKNANCFGLQNWWTAMNFSNSLADGQCGLSDGSKAGDWHLPTIDELRIFADTGYCYDTLNAQGFSDVQGAYYMSSSIFESGIYYVWGVDMNIGNVYYGENYYDGNYYNVWPVRLGQFWAFESLFIYNGIPSSWTSEVGISSVRVTPILNNGNAAVSFTAALSGPDAAEFSVNPGSCGSTSPTLNPGDSCTLQVFAQPTSIGNKSALLTISTASASQEIPLTLTAYSTIHGSITDMSSGQPVTGATISSNTGPSTLSTETGIYSLRVTSPDTNNLTISKPGYQTITKTNLVVTYTSSVIVDILLPTVDTFNITTQQLPSATTGEPYSSRVMVVGGTYPFTFSISYNELPPGLALNPATGLISGTPSASSGNYPFAVTVTDAANNSSESYYIIEMSPSFLITTPPQLPRATVGSTIPTILSASGGVPGYTFSGTLPAGLTLAANGQIQGTPTAAGNYNFTVTVNDSTGRPATRQFSLPVDQPLTITTPRLADATVGSAYSQPISYSGGYGAKNWSLYSGVLPQGLTFDPTNGIISGTPLEAVSRRITLSLQDAAGRVIYQDYTLVSASPLEILTSTLPNVHPGQPYSEKVRVTGGVTPYHYSMSGALPTGLTLNPDSGLISGTTSATGLKNVSISVVDSSYPTPKSITQNAMGIRVNNTAILTQAVTPTTSALLPNAARDAVITPLTFSAAGGTQPYSWSIVGGAIPDGLSFDGTTGILSGTPILPGDFSFILHLGDAAGNKTNDVSNPDKTFFMHVSDKLAVSTSTLPVAAVGKPFSVQLDAAGGLPPYSWNISGLPGDLTYNPSSGVISGTPAASSNNTLTIAVADSDSPAQLAQVTLNLDVSSVMTILETSVPDARLGQGYSANIGARFGIAPYVWRVSSGNLPEGINMQQTASGIVLTGTPAVEGSATFTLELTDSAVQRQIVTRQFTLNVLPSLQISTTTLATVPKGNPYSQPIAVSGGKTPYSYAVSGGNLLQGLSLNSSSGEIGGILAPTAVQSGSVTIRVTDSGIPSASVERQYTLTAAGGFSVSGSVLSGSATGSITCSGPSSAGGSAACSLAPLAGYVLKLLTDNGVDVTSGVVSGNYSIAAVTADHALVATFGLAAPATLTLQKSDAAAGSVSSSPSGISCDSGCASTSGSFNEGTAVVLTAQPSFGYYFLNWQGCASSSGNQCSLTIAQAMSPVTANFSAQKPTALSISPTAKALALNEPLTMSGQLSTIPPASSADISGQPITVTVKDPTGATTTYTTSTKDSDGHWDITLTSFTARGSYIVRAAYAGALKLMASQSDTAAVMVEKSAGYAIVIHGKIPSNEGLEDHRYTTDNIINSLLSRSFMAEDIRYLNSTTTSAPTKAEIQSAIETWAKNRMNAIPAPLYIILVNHGVPGVFHIGSDTITPAELDTWISNLESGLNSTAAAELRNIIIGTCYSGSFIPSLAKPGRVIVTSAADSEESIRGKKVPTSTPGEFVNSGEYFLDELFGALERGKNLKSAFLMARDAVNAKDPRTVPLDFHSGVYDTFAQHPLLNDSGSGNGSYQLDGSQDGAIAVNVYLGEGVVKTNAADNPSAIRETTPTSFLASSTSSATLWLKPHLNSRVDAAWIEIRKPGTTVSGTGNGSQVILPFETVMLTFNAALGRWETTYNGFTTPGSYHIYYHTRDSLTRFVSSAAHSVVYRNKSVNTAPAPFNLLSPADQSQQNTLLTLDWQASSDNDPLSYTLLVSKDANFTTVDHTQSGLTASSAVIGPDANLTNNSTYYWKVLAIDVFGETRQSSQVWRFKTSNAGGLPGIVRGVVRGTTGAPLAGASVTSTGIAVVTAEDGVFQFTVPAATYDLSITAAGYGQASRTGLVVNAGAVLLMPDVQLQGEQQTLTINTGANGTVSSDKGGLTCSGSYCSGSFAYGTSIKLTPAPSGGYLFSGWNGGGCSGLEPCTITITGNTTLTAGFGQALSLTVTMPGTGGGSVNSNPAGIACASGSSAGCTAQFPSGNTVTLMPSANSVSMFDGWSLCSGTGNCAVSMTSPKTVVATFTAAPRAKIGTKGYSTLALAYGNVTSGATATILLLGTDLGTEVLTVNNSKILTLIGGHTASFAKGSNPTLLKGPLTVETGSLTVDGLTIR